MTDNRAIIIVVMFCILQVTAQKCTSPQSIFDAVIYTNEAFIDPRFEGTVIEFDVENVNKISASGSFVQYINAELSDGKLKIFTLPEFKNYELQQTSDRLTLLLSVDCVGETKTITFIQRINAVNNFEPEFSSSGYEIIIPTPLPPRLDITMFLLNSKITVIDRDLQFFQLSFNITGTNLFNVEGVLESAGSKQYTIKLITAQQIARLEGDLSFNLMATDSFNPSKSSMVTVKVKSDPEIITINSPAFTMPLYKGTLMGNRTLQIEDISLQPDSYDEAIQFEIMNDEFDTFLISNDGPKVSISLKENDLKIGILQLRYINLLIKASKAADTPGYATVQLDIESKEQKVPVFLKNLYEGTLEENAKNLTIETIIVDPETFSMDTVFELEGTYADSFTVQSSDNEITLSLTNDANIADLMKQDTLRLTVTAYKQLRALTSSTEISIRIVRSPISSPSFIKEFYVGSLFENAILLDVIQLTEISPDVSVALDGEYSELFVIQLNGRDVTLSAAPNAKFPGEVQYFSVVLVATNPKASNDGKAFVTLMRNNEKPERENLKFEKNLYEGSITDQMILNLEKVIILDDTFTEQVTVSLSGKHSDLFSFTRLRNEITLSLQSGVTLDQLLNVQYLQLSISASFEGLNTASATIILGIERPVVGSESLAFNKKLFEGSITDQMILNLEKVIILEDTFTEQVTVSLSGKHSDLFSFTRLRNEITLSLQSGVTLDQLLNVQYLQLSISASFEGLNTASATIILGIERPVVGSESLAFNKKLFEGSITDQMILNLEKVIILEDTFTEQVTVSLSGKHSDLFSFTRLRNEITLSLRSGVTLDQLLNVQYLQLSISASFEGLNTASATIILGIERPVVGSESLAFNKKLFEGSITDQMILNLEKVIILEDTFTEQVTVSLSGKHSDLFSFTRLRNEITLSLQSGVTLDQLLNVQYLQLSISASFEGLNTASATIILGIERPVVGSESLAFNKKLFEGSITDQMILNLEKVIILEDTFTEQVTVSLSGKHSDLFSFTRLRNEITLSLQSGVTLDQLLNVQYLQLSISASFEGLNTASATIILGIERPVVGSESLAFNKKLFEGSITDQMILNLEKVIILEDTFTEQVTVSLSGKHSDLFSFTRLRNEITLSLQSGVTLDQLLNVQYLQLSISASFEGLNTASATIILGIERPVVGSESLAFNKKLFEGSITDQMILNLEKVIILEDTFTEQVTVSLSGKHSDLFSFTRLRNEITLSLQSGVTLDQLLNVQYLQLSISASFEGLNTASATIILGIERPVVGSESLAFNKKLFEGSITDQMILNLEKVIILEDTFTEQVTVSLSGKHSDLFSFTRLRNEITLSLQSGLTLDQLLNVQYLQLSISASFEGLNTASATIILGIERPVVGSESLAFNKKLFEGSITDQMILNLEKVIILEDTFTEQVTVSLSGKHSDLFSFTRLRNEITLSLQSGVTLDQLLNVQYLQLSISASFEGLNTASATIILGIERPVVGSESLAFNKKLFEGSITDQMILNLEKVIILEDTFTEQVTVSLSGKHSDLFSFTRLRNEITLSLQSGVTLDQLLNVQYLQLSISASFEGLNTASATIILGIERPVVGSESLAFNKKLFEGSITDQMILNLEKVIILEDTFTEQVTVSLSGKHSDLFSFTRLRNEITLSLRNGVTLDQLLNVQYLQLSISASFEGLNTASATIILGIERPVVGSESLAFNKKLFEGSITDQMILNLEKVIILEDTFTEQVTVSLSGKHSDLFSFTRLRNEITLSLQSGVTLDQLLNVQYLQLSISASFEGLNTASATIILGIERPVVGSESLAFNKKLFEGSITDQMILNLEKVIILEDTFTEQVTVSLSGKHSDLFSFTRLRNEITLSLQSGVTLDQLLNVQYLQLSISASFEGLNTASATIILGIERRVDEIFKFENDLYIGSVNNQRELSLEVFSIVTEKPVSALELVGEDSSFFSVRLDQNFVVIDLIGSITEDLLLTKSILKFQVLAANEDRLQISTNAVVTLPRLRDDTILRFVKSTYTGSYNSVALSIELEDIVLELNNYDASVNFLLDRQDGESFEIVRSSNVVNLKLKDDFNQELIKNKVFLTLTIRAERNGYASAETIVFIQLPVTIQEVETISFTKVNYRGTLDYNRDLKIEGLVLHPNPSDPDISIVLVGDDAKKFLIQRNDETLQLSINPSIVIELKTPFFFYIEAIKLGSVKAQASIFIDIVDKYQLHFDNLKYSGKLNNAYELIIDPIKLGGDAKLEDVTIRLKDGDSKFFSVEKTDTNIVIKRIYEINEGVLKNKQILWFYLEASGSQFYPAEALILIELPSWSSVPIEDCYDILDPTQPYFETGSYAFTVTNEDIGSIGRVRAFVIDSGDLTYILYVDDELLQEKITIQVSSGDLILRSPLAVGSYKMIARAMNSNAKSAEARVTLRVIEARECTEDVQITVEKVLTIEILLENAIHSTIMSSRINGCNYVISDVSPGGYRGIFMIDRSTNFLRNNATFDRESQYFEDTLVPQITIRLDLQCQMTLIAAQKSGHSFTDNLMVEGILYSKTVTYLNILILDENDNSPIFTFPSEDNFYVGFPDADLVEKLMPKTLITVEAYDLDEGINAEIRYSLEPTEHFSIDSETGDIYPLKNCMLNVDIVQVIVKATDEYGDGNVTPITLNVRKIKAEHVVMLTIENEALEDVESVIDQISDDLSLDVRIINYYAVTSVQEAKSIVDSKIIIFAYAFNEDTNLIAGQDLIEVLQKAELNYVATVTAFKDNVYKTSDCNLTGLVVAVSILGSLLLLISIGTPLLWFLWLRYKMNDKSSKDSESSVEKLEEYFNNEDEGRSSPIATSSITSRSERSDAEIIGIDIEGVTEESTSDYTKLNDQLIAILDGTSPSELDSPSDKKKTNVRFNELVERIEVISDTDLMKDNLVATHEDKDQNVRL